MRTYGFFFALLLGLAAQLPSQAGIKTQIVEYKDGDTALEGYLAYDDALKGKLPTILIVHEWNGLGSYVQRRAREIAQLGYVGFAIDIYGKGMRPTTREESSKQASIYRNDRPLMRRRALAGLTEAGRFPFVDEKRIAAMGYCFGGGVVLEMARSGAALVGVVSFHGTLDTPHPEETRNVLAKILVLHGADDPATKQEQIVAFENEMRQAKTDWEMVIYGNAVHGFTNPDNGSDPSKGVAYNKEADLRSWQAMKDFFKEIFAREASPGK